MTRPSPNRHQVDLANSILIPPPARPAFCGPGRKGAPKSPLQGSLGDQARTGDQAALIASLSASQAPTFRQVHNPQTSLAPLTLVPHLSLLLPLFLFPPSASLERNANRLHKSRGWRIDPGRPHNFPFGQQPKLLARCRFTGDCRCTIVAAASQSPATQHRRTEFKPGNSYVEKAIGNETSFNRHRAAACSADRFTCCFRVSFDFSCARSE